MRCRSSYDPLTLRGVQLLAYHIPTPRLPRPKIRGVGDGSFFYSAKIRYGQKPDRDTTNVVCLISWTFRPKVWRYRPQNMDISAKIKRVLVNKRHWFITLLSPCSQSISSTDVVVLKKKPLAVRSAVSYWFCSVRKQGTRWCDTHIQSHEHSPYETMTPM